MTIDKIISAFMCGSCNVKGCSSLHIENWTIYSYATPIAQLYEGALHINADKYSKTTSTLQNKLRRRAKITGLKEFTYTENQFKDTFKL